jgi:hypothetical protein
LTTQGPIASRDSDTTDVAFRFCGQRRLPKVYYILWVRRLKPAGSSGWKFHTVKA